MKIFVACLLCLFYLTSVSLEAKYRFDETVFIPLPNHIPHQWKIERQTTQDKGASVTHYLLESETDQNWTQLINIQFKDRQLMTSRSAEEAMQEEASQSIGVNCYIHSKNPNDLIYERTFPSGEHEVVRMIMTKKGLHRAGYVKRGSLSESERSQWIERLSTGVIGGRN